jgi:DsbC/DsbD-like thiol-disulfide interchange protein
MNAEANLAAQGPAQIAAEVKVLVCREMCIPGKSQVSLTLPVKPQTSPVNTKSADLFAAARKALPRPAPANWKFGLSETNDSFVLTGNLGRRITYAIFFPLAESQVSNAAPQALVPMASGFSLTLRKSDQLLKPIARLKGVLVLSGERAYSIDVPVGEPIAASTKGTG